MYIIVSTSHNYQCMDGGNASDTDRFKKFIIELCEGHSVDTIAEEYNEDAEQEMHCDEIVCKTVCDNLGIDHLYIDPNRTERQKLGISDISSLNYLAMFHNWSTEKLAEEKANNYTIRETYWLNKITENTSDDDVVLVVIGADHEDSFLELLDENGIEYEVYSFPEED